MAEEPDYGDWKPLSPFPSGSGSRQRGGSVPLEMQSTVPTPRSASLFAASSLPERLEDVTLGMQSPAVCLSSCRLILLSPPLPWPESWGGGSLFVEGEGQSSFSSATIRCQPCPCIYLTADSESGKKRSWSVTPDIGPEGRETCKAKDPRFLCPAQMPVAMAAVAREATTELGGLLSCSPGSVEL